MLMNTTSVMLTVFVLNLHHRHDNKPVPRWVRSTILIGLGRLLCMANDGDSDKADGAHGSRYLQDSSFRKRSKNCNDTDCYNVKCTGDKHTGKFSRSQAHSNSTYQQQYSTRKQNNVADSRHYRNDVITLRNNTDSASTELDERHHHRDGLLMHAAADGYHLSEPITERRTLDDWRQLARVMDRLFFWFTLLALVCFFVTVFFIAWT